MNGTLIAVAIGVYLVASFAFGYYLNPIGFVIGFAIGLWVLNRNRQRPL